MSSPEFHTHPEVESYYAKVENWLKAEKEWLESQGKKEIVIWQEDQQSRPKQSRPRRRNTVHIPAHVALRLGGRAIGVGHFPRNETKRGIYRRRK